MTSAVPWLDEDHPHDEDESVAQIGGLLRLLAPAPKRVLELGCGGGRVLEPLVRARHLVTGVDRDPAAIERCRTRLGGLAEDAVLVTADFRERWRITRGSLDAVVCVGNTFMTIADVDQAVDLLRRAADALAPGGVFVMDDCPADFWPELVEGNWTAGISEDGDAQLVWSASDAVFALRQGDAIDPESWTPAPTDRPPLRLWTDGALRLAARAAALSAPVRVEGAHLLVMRRP